MKKWLRAFTFIIIFVILFYIIDRLFDPVGTTGEWQASNIMVDFYKKKQNTIDVLYVGSSNVYAGISPLEVYERTGVTGYSVSSPEQKVWSSYYMIKEAFKTQKPQVIFLETGEFFSDTSDQNEQSKRKAIDSLKMSQNKIDMINDSVYGLTNFDKFSCYINILRYHSRWSNMGWSDITKFFNTSDHTYEGYIFDRNIKSYNGKKEEKDTTNLLQMPDVVKDYLDKIIEICNDNNCSLVLMGMPTPQTWCQEKHDDIETYALQNDLNYIDLNDDDNITIDWEKDSSDGGLHLNIYGAEKVGEYLANYIDENYDLPDHRNDELKETWNKYLNKYNNKKANAKAE